MARNASRRTRAAGVSLNLVVVVALIAQLALAAGVVNAAPASAEGGSSPAGGYTFGFDDFSHLKGLRLNGVAQHFEESW